MNCHSHLAVLLATGAIWATGTVPAASRAGRMPAPTVAHQNPPLAEVPFTQHQNGVIVKAVVNSRDTVQLLLDTGWGPLALLSSTAGRLGLGVTTGGAYPLARAKSLALGNAIKRDVTFELFAPEALQPLIGPHDGVLSTAFFRDLVVQIDYPHRLLRFFASAPPKREGATEIPMVFSSGAGALPFSDSVTIDGKQVRGLFDTGGAGGFLGMPQLLDRPGVVLYPDTGSRIGIQMFHGGQARSATLRFARVERIAVGNIVREMTRVPVAPAELEGGGWGHDVIVGYGFFKDFVVTFDYPGKAIRFESPSRVPVTSSPM